MPEEISLQFVQLCYAELLLPSSSETIEEGEQTSKLTHANVKKNARLNHIVEFI